jgi:anti-sigma regulatory factor (Ser/Thr protein kinase)
MTMIDAAGAAQAYRHEAVFYRGLDDYVASVASFVLDGVRAGDPVMVAVPTRHLADIRSTVGDPTGVHLVDMTEMGANPARIIPAWREFVDAHPEAGCIRGVGEPVWAERRDVELDECHLHEALLNVAIDPRTPLWLRCPYDAAALDPATLARARRTHPWVAGDDVVHVGPGPDGAGLAGPLAEPPAACREVAFGADDEADVRQAVAREADAAGLDPARVADLMLAVHEVMVNSIRHGGGDGRLRTWRDERAFVCEVRDRGRIDDPLVGRRTPDLTAESGRGLWMVHQLVDLAQVRSAAAGTTVRLHTWL